MSGLVFGLEWALALRRRRLFVFNVLVPLLLIAPLAVSPAPPAHASAVYAVLFALFGTFGSAIPLIRDGERGMNNRIMASGLAPVAWVIEFSLAGATLDALQLAPCLAVILWSSGADSPVAWAGAFSTLLLTLTIMNVVGVWVAAVSRSIAEGALLAAVTALFLLHGAGVFRTPAPETWGARIEALDPLHHLHDLLLGLTGASPAVPLGPRPMLELLAAVTVLLALTGLAAPRLARILAATERGS